MDRASADNQSYRRGQALGFTVAELFTLLLFLVLLILAAVEQHEKKADRQVQEKWHQVQKELEDAKHSAAILAEKNKRLRDYFGVPNNFGDDFKDLVPGSNVVSNFNAQQALGKLCRS